MAPATAGPDGKRVRPNPVAVATATPATAGWVTRDGRTRYVRADGMFARGMLELDGDAYCLDPSDGHLITGEVNVGGSWFFFDPRAGGRMAREEYVNLGTKIVYYDASGAMVMGREYRTPDGAWHYLDAYDGHLARNEFVNLGHKWVYYDSVTKMAFGERNVGGNWYYFDPVDGSMAYCRFVTLPDGRTVYYDESGHMVFGGRYVDGALRYFNRTDGHLTDTSDAIYRSSDWEMAGRAQWYGSSTGNLILVDTASNVVGVYAGELGNWREVNYFSCSDGKASTPTVHGVFTLGVKGYYFDSGNCRRCYYSQISGEYLFHSVLYYQTPSPRYVMDGTLGASVSHGCVRLAFGDAYYIYAYVPSGTTVVVY